MKKNEVSILDDAEAMASVDKGNMLKVVEDLPEQVKNAMKIDPPEIDEQKPDLVVVAGMGGSAICGDIIASWLKDRLGLPMIVVRDYALPASVTSRSLVIAVSFSGNTEETLSAFEDAVARNSHAVAISTGGMLKTRSEELGVPHMTISPEEKLAPRAAVAYLLFPVISILSAAGLVNTNEIREELDDAVKTLELIRSELRAGIEQKENLAKQLAIKLKNSSPLIYAAEPFVPAAYRWVTQLNENSKIIATARALPEMNHNDIVGMTGDDNTGSYSVILLRDPGSEEERMRKRIELTKDLAFSRAAEIVEIHARGEHTLAKILSLIYIGDYTSVYLAVLRGIDPTPVEVIEKLKELMRG